MIFWICWTIGWFWFLAEVSKSASKQEEVKTWTIKGVK